MSSEEVDQVQQYQPFARLSPKRVMTVAADQIHPVVRIAHRSRGPIDIPERIIFDHEFVLILAGSGVLVLGSERYPYVPHDLLFIPPFVPHRFVPGSTSIGEHIAVHFDFSLQMIDARSSLMDRAPYEVRLAHPMQIPTKRSLAPGDLVGLTLQNIERLHGCSDALSALRLTRDMLTVLEHVSVNATEENPASASAIQVKNQARIERVIAFIRANLSKPLDVDALAVVADISSSRMNTLFRQATGYSPLEYVRRARVAEARRLLADLELSVKEIASRTGFEDSFHFSKVFRRIDGLSPTHYRDALVASRPR